MLINTKVKVIKSLVCKEIDGKIYVLHPEEGKVYLFNETSSFIWKLLQKNIALIKIVDYIRHQYNIDQSTASKDLLKFINRSTKRKLITISQ